MLKVVEAEIESIPVEERKFTKEEKKEFIEWLENLQHGKNPAMFSVFIKRKIKEINERHKDDKESSTLTPSCLKEEHGVDEFRIKVQGIYDSGDLSAFSKDDISKLVEFYIKH